jgi:hypothetical protein
MPNMNYPSKTSISEGTEYRPTAPQCMSDSIIDIHRRINRVDSLSSEISEILFGLEPCECLANEPNYSVVGKLAHMTGTLEDIENILKKIRYRLIEGE